MSEGRYYGFSAHPGKKSKLHMNNVFSFSAFATISAIAVLLLQAINYTGAEYCCDDAAYADGTCPTGVAGLLVFLPHKYDCSKYFRCKDGVPVLVECALGLYFNHLVFLCLLPEASNCKPKPEPPCWVGECPKEDTEEPCLLPHRCRCNKYFTCKKGVPEPCDCPDGKHFNPVSKVCEDPEKAGCKDDSGY